MAPAATSGTTGLWDGFSNTLSWQKPAAGSKLAAALGAAISTAAAAAAAKADAGAHVRCWQQRTTAAV